MDIRFTNILDTLSIRVNGSLFKHCRACGYRLYAKHRELAAHFKRYHRGQEPAWLGYDERPADSCYANFLTYLTNPDTELVLLPHIRHPGGGRVPLARPSPFAISRVEPPVIERPAPSDIESCFFKRSAVDLEMASSLADLQPDGHESLQIEQRCDQKSLRSESRHQRPSQSGPGPAQAAGRAAALAMDTGLAMLEVQPAGGAQDDQEIKTGVQRDKE